MAVDFQRQERVVRLLNLLAYASNHPGLTPMEIARDLGADPVQVRDDFELLFLSGVGTGPGEMIDLEYSWKGVDIIDDQGMTKPLRLSPAEASALLILLDSLETMPGLVDARAVRSAAAKIRTVAKTQAVGDAEHSGEAYVASTVADALAQKRQLRITYYSASSDTTSTRHVEPAGLFHQSGATYMHATQDGEMKTFRLDRIRSAELLDAPSATTVVGCARVFPTDTGSRFGRFVVRPDYRGTGLGHEIVRAGIEYTQRWPGDLVIEAQAGLVGYCSQFGLVAEGEEFEPAGLHSGDALLDSHHH